jgi:DNA-binding transcriptional ArsR family regulator
MPTPELDLIIPPTTTSVFQFGLEPAHNALNSLMLLTKADRLSGLDEWVIRTRSTLTAEQRNNNILVLEGFHYAITPDRSWTDFPTYIQHLSAEEPLVLRNRLLDAYLRIPPREEAPRSAPTRETLMESQDAFLRFLLNRFPPEHVHTDVEAEAYTYLNDPPAMQGLIVSHLSEMWASHLAPEWERITPLLTASAEAFQEVDFSGLTRSQVLKQVTGQDMEICSEPELEKLDRIVFVPSAHVGPYLGRFKTENTLWVVFGARLPAGSRVSSPDLSRAEILVRLSALADDTRLRVLRCISEEGELSSKEIMTQLDLSQSAASRHLKQLSATGYLNERRCEGAKCYTLNPEKIDDTLQAISTFLLVN